MSVRLTTKTVFTFGHDCSAKSVFFFKGIARPPRTPSLAVITQLELQSCILWDRASGENPPKTTEWIAPIRVHASMAMVASGIIGI